LDGDPRHDVAAEGIRPDGQNSSRAFEIDRSFQTSMREEA
jgi:hypothetical protein